MAAVTVVASGAGRAQTDCAADQIVRAARAANAGVPGAASRRRIARTANRMTRFAGAARAVARAAVAVARTSVVVGRAARGCGRVALLRAVAADHVVGAGPGRGATGVVDTRFGIGATGLTTCGTTGLPRRTAGAADALVRRHVAADLAAAAELIGGALAEILAGVVVTADPRAAFGAGRARVGDGRAARVARRVADLRASAADLAIGTAAELTARATGTADALIAVVRAAVRVRPRATAHAAAALAGVGG